MVDAFAPSPNRLDERFTFPDAARIKDELRGLVQLVEARLFALESFEPDWKIAVDGIIAAQNQRLVDSIGAQAAQITAWAAEAQESAEAAQYAASQAGFVNAGSYVLRDGTVSFTGVVGGVAPSAGTRTSALVTGAWVGTEIDTKAAATTAEAHTYADAAGLSAISAVVAGAPANLNTLDELALAIGDNANFSIDTANNFVTVNTALGNRLRVDADQGLTAASVAQTRRNIRPPVSAKNANYTAVANDIGTLFVCTGAAAWTLSLTAAATLGAGWEVFVRNDGSRVVTIDPNGGELIDGAATQTLLPKQDFAIRCDGTGFYTIGRQNHVRLRRTVIGAALGAVDFTLDDGYDVYEVEIINHTGDGSSIAMRLSNDAGATFSAGPGAYNYGYQRPSTASTDETVWNAAASEMYVCVVPINAPPPAVHVALYNARNVGAMSFMRTESAGRTATSLTGHQKLVGYVGVARDDNAIRFFPLTGTLTSGTYILNGIT